MTRFALIFLATPAFAEPPSSITGMGANGSGQDTLSVTAESPIMGLLEYHNSGAQTSHSGDFRVKDGPIDCTVTIDVGHDETARVACLHGFVSEPQEADVPDGESFIFVVMRPLG